MRFCVSIISLFLAFIHVATASPVTREQCERDFRPQSGLAGKDVVWVPTLDEMVTAMLKAAKTTASDYVVDLGSGDGKIPIAAAKQFGATALGIEYNPKLVQLAQCFVRAEGVEDKVQIKQADIFKTDFSRATVLTLYLLPELNRKLRPKILAMKPGTRVVSNSFQMGDWSPDEYIESEIGNTQAFLWIVPAQVAGNWVFREEGGTGSFDLALKQSFQHLSNDVAQGEPGSIRDARLRGMEITFTWVDAGGRSLRMSGRVLGGAMHVATVRNGRRVRFSGARIFSPAT